MATPKEMVKRIAELTGLPETSVATHDRNLAVAGLRGMAGRGRAVNKVSAQDASRLIVAAMASRNVKDSALTISRFSSEASAIALDIERAMAGHAPATQYNLRSEKGEAFWVSGISGNAVKSIADLIAA